MRHRIQLDKPTSSPRQEVTEIISIIEPSIVNSPPDNQTHDDDEQHRTPKADDSITEEPLVVQPSNETEWDNDATEIVDDTQNNNCEIDWNINTEECYEDPKKTLIDYAEGLDVFGSRDYEDKDSEYEDQDDLIYGDLQLFFHAINEPQLAQNFVDQKVTLGQLLAFEEKDLINCGVEFVGDRKKILEHIAQWHSDQWLPTSMHDLTSKSVLTSPGFYIVLNDINKHFEYIDASFRFMRRQIEMKPKILELGKDYCGVKKVLSELDDLTQTYTKMSNSIKLLHKELSKHADKPSMQPPNLIDERCIWRTRIGTKIIPWSMTAAMVALGLTISIRYL